MAEFLDLPTAIARTVRDASLLLSHMVGRDPMDATSLDWPEPIAVPQGERLDGVRVGVVEELMGEGVDPGVRDAVAAALAKVEELGGIARQRVITEENHHR